MPPSSSDNHVSILLDISEQIGALNANMIAAMHSRDRMEKSLEKLTSEVAEIKPVVLEVKDMKPRIEELTAFKSRVGLYVWIGSSIVMGVLSLLWQGFLMFSEVIKAQIGKMFH